LQHSKQDLKVKGNCYALFEEIFFHLPLFDDGIFVRFVHSTRIAFSTRLKKKIINFVGQSH